MELLGSPTASEMAESVAPSGLAWDAYRGVLSAGTIKMLWAKSDAPEDSINDLRYAFEQARADENFIAVSAEANGPYEGLVGQEAYNAMSSTLEMSDETLNFLRETFKEQYGVDL